MNGIRLALIVVAALVPRAGSAAESDPTSTQAAVESGPKRSDVMDQYTRRYAALASAVDTMRAQQTPLYLRHKPDVDVRAWAIDQCLHKLPTTSQPQQQELSQRLEAALVEAQQVLDALAAGQDFLQQKRGLLLRGIVVDGQPHPLPYAVHVPDRYDAGTTWPLFVYLHGGGGSVDQARYALDRVYSAAQAEQAKSDQPAFATQHYIKIWLPRRGDHWAEPPNEDSVFAAIADTKANYTIDPNRVYVQGFSMGGFASMHFAVRYPGELAGTGPSGMPNVGAFLPFVENLTNLPVYLCHGARDDTCLPNNSATLFDRLRAGPYDAMFLQDAQLGHGTPAETRAGQEFWLMSKTRTQWPHRVVYVTDDPRYHRAYWVDILKLEPIVKPLLAKMPADFQGTPPTLSSVQATRYTIGKQAILEPLPDQPLARIDAARAQPGEFTVKTDHIESFAILLSPDLAPPGEPLKVSIDSQPALTLPWPPDNRLVFTRAPDASWHPAPGRP
jgi:predicted esterase